MFIVISFIQKPFLKYFKLLTFFFNLHNLKLGKIVNF